MLQRHFVIGLQSVQLSPAGSRYTFTVAGLLLLTTSLTTSENTYTPLTVGVKCGVAVVAPVSVAVAGPETCVQRYVNGCGGVSGSTLAAVQRDPFSYLCFPRGPAIGYRDNIGRSGERHGIDPEEGTSTVMNLDRGNRVAR
jgi:hypothetical protein